MFGSGWSPGVRRLGNHSLAGWLALGRLVAARKAYARLAGPLLSGAAGRYVDSLYGPSGAHSDVRTRILQTVQVDPPQVAEFPFPAGWPPFFRRSKSFDARMRYHLRDVVVSPLSGLTWTPSGRIIGESIGSVHRLLGWGNVAHEMLFPVDRARMQSPVVCTVSTNFGHWLFESLPRVLEAIAAHPETTILLPADQRDRPRFIDESLRLALGDAKFEASVRYAARPHRVEELVLTSMPVDPYFIHPATVPFLRTVYASQRVSPAQKRAVYISRKNSQKRRMDNEDALEAFMVSCGFDVILVEDMSFGERIRLFSQAHTVVGPHGAGLSCILWCAPGTQVIELLPPEDFSDFFARLSSSNGLLYRYVQADAGVQAGGLVSLRALESELLGSTRARTGHRQEAGAGGGVRLPLPPRTDQAPALAPPRDGRVMGEE